MAVLDGLGVVGRRMSQGRGFPFVTSLYETVLAGVFSLFGEINCFICQPTNVKQKVVNLRRKSVQLF